MIDARIHHDPALAPGLVAAAIQAAGSQAEAARRAGLSREYLRQLSAGRRRMSYAVQALLQQIADGA